MNHNNRLENYVNFGYIIIPSLLPRSVHLPEGRPHGGPSRQGGLRLVQSAGHAARGLVLWQRRRPPRQAREGVVLLQRLRPVQQWHEARRRRPRRRLGPHQSAADVVLHSRPLPEPMVMGRYTAADTVVYCDATRL